MTAPTDPARYGPPSSTVYARVAAADLVNVLGRLADMGLNAKSFALRPDASEPSVEVDPPHPQHQLRAYAKYQHTTGSPAGAINVAWVGGVRIYWYEEDTV